MNDQASSTCTHPRPRRRLGLIPEGPLLRMFCLLAVCAAVPCGNSAPASPSAGSLVRNLQMTFYEKAGGRLTTTVLGRAKASQIFVDHQKKGFFRIGLMPFLVVTDLDLQIAPEAWTGMNLDQLRRQLGAALGTSAICEIRGLRLGISGQHHGGLQAELLTIRDNTLELRQVTITQPDGSQMRFESARCSWRGNKIVDLSPDPFASAFSECFGFPNHERPVMPIPNEP